MATTQSSGGKASGGKASAPAPAATASRTRTFTPRAVRRRAVVRRVDPWSVLKLSLIFYFCLLLVVMLGLTIFWSVINNLGVIDALRDLLAEFRLEIVEINGGNIARAVFLLGLINVVLWSAVNVFLAFLYNLVSDLVGGLQVTLAEEE